MAYIRTYGGKCLTGAGDTAGYLLASRKTCLPQILIRTDDLQHPQCVSFKLDGRSWSSANVDSTKYSAGYRADPGEGSFRVLLGWVLTHSPYPEIESMRVWLYGIDTGFRGYNLVYSDSDYKEVARVTVAADGRVTVGSKDAGIWPDMIG